MIGNVLEATMKPKRICIFLVCATFFLGELVACKTDLSEGLRFECKSNKQCADGYECAKDGAGTGVCVKEGTALDRPDADVSDADAADAGDVGPRDTGPQDTGPRDSGPDDTGVHDTGPDAVAVDATSDVQGADTGPDGGICPDGRTMCRGQCVDLSSDVAHCGGCDAACATAPAHSASACKAGICVYTCEPNWADGDGDWAGEPGPTSTTNGCESACSPTNGGDEACDGIDNDCNGLIDDNAPMAAEQVVTGGDHTCALLSGIAYCWGRNDEGQLGDGTTTHRDRPVLVQTSGTFEQLAAGKDFTCGVTANNDVWCWGANEHSQVGREYVDTDPSTDHYTTPVKLQGLPSITIDTIVAGNYHACVLASSDHKLYCWGSDASEQLGRYVQGTRSPLPEPVVNKISSPTAYEFSAAAAGAQHSCGIENGGSHQTLCWGRNTETQAGASSLGNTVDWPTDLGQSTSFSMIAAGGDYSCASDGSVTYCWGRNNFGQVGSGSSDPEVWPPEEVSGLQGVTSLALGTLHSCALLNSGQISCWGANTHGQLGDGTITNASTPTSVQSSRVFSAVDAGGAHTCAIEAVSQEVVCWGLDQYGQLGNGAAASTDALTPVAPSCPR